MTHAISDKIVVLDLNVKLVFIWLSNSPLVRAISGRTSFTQAMMQPNLFGFSEWLSLRGPGQLQMENRNDAPWRGWTRIRASGRLVDQGDQMQDKLAATLAALFTG